MDRRALFKSCNYNFTEQNQRRSTSREPSATEDDEGWSSDNNHSKAQGWALQNNGTCGDDVGSSNQGGLIKGGSNSYMEGQSFPSCMDEIELPSNADDWLALRVIGGARSWSLPNFPKLKCFSNEM